MANRYVRRYLFPEEPFRPLQNQFFQEMADAWDEVAQPLVDDIIYAIPLLNEDYAFDYISTSNPDFNTYEGTYCVIDPITNTCELLTDDDLVKFDSQTTVMQTNKLGFTFFDPSLFNDADYREIHASIGYFYWEKGTANFIDFFAYSFNAVFTMEMLWGYWNGAQPEQYVNPSHPGMQTESSPEIQTAIALGQTIWDNPQTSWNDDTVYPTSHVNIYYDPIKFPSTVEATVRKFFYYVAPLNLVLSEVIELVDLPTPLYFITATEIEEVLELA